MEPGEWPGVAPEGNLITLREQAVGHQGGGVGEAEGPGEARRGQQGRVGPVDHDWGCRAALQFGVGQDVVEVAVGVDNGHHLQPVGLDDRGNLLDIVAGVDDHRLAAVLVGQDVAVGVELANHERAQDQR
jgi:hypothetical protein